MGTRSDRELTVLYGPNLVPPDTWLRRTLFNADTVATLISNTYAAPDRLKLLEDHGAWRPAILDSLTPEVLNPLADEALSVAEHYPWVQAQHLNSKDKVLAGKFPYQLEASLINQGLLTRLDDDPQRYGASDDRLIPTMISLCGATLADQHGWRMDIRSEKVVDSVLRPIEREAEEALAVTKPRLPEFREDVPIEQALAFRTQYRDEFRAYRHYLARTEEADIDEALGATGVSKDLDAALQDLIKAAHMAGLPIRARTRTWVRQLTDTERAFLMTELGLTIGAVTLPSDSVGAKLAAAAVAAGLTARLVRIRRRRKAVTYMSQAMSRKLVQFSS